MLVQNADVIDANVVTTLYPVVERIRNLTEDELGPVVVLIGAPTHSGKSTFSQNLEETLAYEGVSVTTLSNDLWLMGLNRTPAVIITVMENFHEVEFEKAIRQLLDGEAIRPPIYDFKTRMHVSDEGEPFFFKEGVLILDGSVILAMEGLREISSLNLYVEIPEHIRMEWLRQCSLGFKGMSPAETRRRLSRKGGAPIARASARYADIIYRPDPDSLPVDVTCDHK